MSRVKKILLTAAVYGVMLGTAVGSTIIIMATHETKWWVAYGPIVMTMISSLGLGKLLSSLAVEERATELRAVIAYALKLNDTHVLRIHASGDDAAMRTLWPGWPHFLAEFRKAEREA